MREEEIPWHLGPYPTVNTTCETLPHTSLVTTCICNFSKLAFAAHVRGTTGGSGVCLQTGEYSCSLVPGPFSGNPSSLTGPVQSCPEVLPGVGGAS